MDLWLLGLTVESEGPSPRQAEEAPVPPPAAVPVRKARGAAEGDPDAV